MRYSIHLLCRFLPSLFFTLFAFLARAQSGSLTLAGKVVDQTTGEPIPSANITVVGRPVGAVTNEKGVFRLTIPTVSASDSVRVSSVGFRSITRKIPEAGRQSLMIRLKPATVTLEEVRVQARRKTAVDILREAVAAIPRNYDTTARQLTAFYREDQQFGAKPVVTSEAVLSVYKAAYNQSEIPDGMKLVKGRKKEYDRAIHQLPLIINLSNGARSSLLYCDFVKLAAHKRNIINERNFRYYDFSLSTLKGDRLMYVVTFKPGKRKRKAFGTGKLYIDAQTMAFVRAEFQSTQAGIDAENNRQWLLKKLASAVHRMNLKFTGLKEVATYSQSGGPGGSGQWNLSQVERHYSFQIDSKSRNLIEKPWEVSTRFTITAVGPKGISPFTEGNLAENQSPFSSLVSNQNNLDSWERDSIQPQTATDAIRSEPPSAVSVVPEPGSATIRVSNRQNGFTRADTLRGMLTPLRSKYDVTFYDLAVKVDIADKAIRGTNKMRFRVLAPLDKLQVDLYANMAIQQIRYAGKPLPYTREHNAVFVQFPQTLKAGSEQEIEIEYAGKPQIPDLSVPMVGGFLWDKDRDGKPWVQVVCQGSGASLWWPNKDHLSDEPDSMRIRVTVPDGLMNISNGRLRRRTALPGNWTQYEWYVSYPINNYNVTLNIGHYAHRRETYGPDSLTLDYYCMPYNQEKFRWIFDGVKPMLATLEKQYGNYPFPRDGFTLMESLHPMEHQSAVSFGKLPASRADSLTVADSLNLMKLVWHEVSHEWWGNNVSCRDMADLWIHEAFATYSEGYYLESVVGEEGELGYMASLLPQVTGREPIIGVRDVNHIHYDIGDLYTKGALMLYTLRHSIRNDTLWAAILKGIQHRFRSQTVSTKDIIGYINEKTGTDYTAFFDQYLTHTASPTLQVKLVEKPQALVVQYRWQADVPGFRMPVRVTHQPDQFGFISPTTDWQTMTLPNMAADDFEVDEVRFYINVEEIEPEFLKQ